MADDSFETDGNTTTEEEGYTPYSERPETYIVPVIFAIIFIVGALGNGTLIYIFIRNKDLRNIPNTYIINLSLGDILVILITVPFVSTIYTLETWPYGEVICKFSEFVRDISIGVSVFTLSALSADRYFAIVNPMRKYMGGQAGRMTIATAILIWVVSIIFAFPSVLFSTVEQKDFANRTILYCTPFPEYLGTSYPRIIIMFKFLMYYTNPLIIISVFYIMMARHLLIISINMPGEAQGQNRQIEARKKVAKMVLSFVVMFAVCFFPIHVFSLWFHYYPYAMEEYDQFWHYFRIAGFCLSFINSCINPIALYCVSRIFREYFNNYLFCCLVPKRSLRNGHCNGTSMSYFKSTLRRTSTTVVMSRSASV